MKRTRIGCIIQARLDSTRLCHKVLRCIGGSGTVLEHVVCAARLSALVNDVCLTTPDLALYYLARDTFCIYPQWWMGKRDPLAEYYYLARVRSHKIIVRLTADCPMLTGEIIDAGVQEFLDGDGDYGYNNTDGADVEVFTFDALAEAYEKAGPDEREHVTTWIRHNRRCIDLAPAAGEFVSLNTAEEYARICELMGRSKRRK